MAQLTDTDIREQVRERYAAAAKAAGHSISCGCDPASAFTEPDMSPTDKSGTEVFGRALYDTEEASGAPAAAVAPAVSTSSYRAEPNTASLAGSQPHDAVGCSAA